jgi:hypothetical protein
MDIHPPISFFNCQFIGGKVPPSDYFFLMGNPKQGGYPEPINVTIDSCKFEEVKLDSAFRAISVMNEFVGSSLIIKSSTFKNLRGASSGVALSLSGCPILEVSNCTFTQIQSTLVGGGVVDISEVKQAEQTTFTDCVFSYNVLSVGGSSLYIHGSRGNPSQYEGLGIFFFFFFFQFSHQINSCQLCLQSESCGWIRGRSNKFCEHMV